jgi:hypothetical protein
VDLLDLYRGSLSYRRVCALVAHLPDDAAVWRAIHPDAGWSRLDLLTAALERRLTALWATVAVAVGHQVSDDDLTSPLDLITAHHDHTAAPAADEPVTLSLREIALMMRDG